MHLKLLLIAALAIFAPAITAQQTQKSMGTIPTADALLSGGLEVSRERARLLSNASITAYDHTAQIDLDRGGLVAICATSAFHLLRSGSADALLFALDRGAVEIRTPSRPQDAILTPDLRFTLLTPGPLDIRLRVTREGDTCVENRGDTAPVLQVVEAFGSAIYHLAPNQHVLFEHGSLHEVVDRETSPCGCPQTTPTMVAITNQNATSSDTPQRVAALNPFPAAQSADLTPAPTPLPVIPAASAALTSGISPADVSSAPIVQTPQPVLPPPAAALPPPAPAISTEPPPSPPGARDLAHRIGRFFKRLFGSKS